jgi:hypothetical protein
MSIERKRKDGLLRDLRRQIRPFHIGMQSLLGEGFHSRIPCRIHSAAQKLTFAKGFSREP